MIQFGGNDAGNVDYDRARVVIIPAPYDRTVTYRKGAAGGPAAIIEASQYMEIFDEEFSQEMNKMVIHTLEPLDILKAEPKDAVNGVYEAVKRVVADNKLPVVLGGEHSVSIGAVKAVKEMHNDITVVHFDAHYDMRDEYAGSKYNHACVGRRMSEMAPVVQFGVRSVSKEEKDFLNTATNVKSISTYSILDDPAWYIKALELIGEKIYLTIDLDVLDPAIMPAVGVPEPGGFAWYMFLDILKKIMSRSKVVGFDVVELAPLDGNVSPDYLASRLVYKLIAYESYYRTKNKYGGRR